MLFRVSKCPVVTLSVFIALLPGCAFVPPAGPDPSAIDSDGDGCSDADERLVPDSCDNNPNTEPGTTPDPSATNTFSLRVARHVDQSFPNDRVDSVFAAANTLLQTVQTECPDVATDVIFKREGPVETFDVTPSILTTESQLDDVFNQPFDIKIVNAMIGVCGISSTDDMSLILGCAAEGESLVIVSEADPDVWAHEWGHVQGLGHRDDCPRNLMHAFELQTNAVNEFERDAFLTPTPPPSPRIALPSLALLPDKHIESLAPMTDEPLEFWLQRTVTKSFLAGVPADAFRRLDSRATEPLTAMMTNPAYDGVRHNLVRALGFAHDPAACPQLIDQIDQTTGPLTYEQFATLAESFLALGRLVPDDPSNRALNFLVDATDVSAASAAAVSWQFGGYAGMSAQRLCARLAIIALSTTTDRRAANHLHNLREQISAGQLPQEFTDQVNEAIARMDRPGRQLPMLAPVNRYR